MIFMWELNERVYLRGYLSTDGTSASSIKINYLMKKVHKILNNILHLENIVLRQESCFNLLCLA